MSTIGFLIVALVFFIYVMLLVVYLITWLKIIKPTNKGQTDLFLSLIVPVRNEAHRIIEFLNGINRQSYNKSKFEIILVNDHSDDTTLQLAESFKNAHIELNILILSLNETSSKKAAITAGIHAAKGELIITTDADCVFQEYWLDSLAGCYTQYLPQMIIAPVLIRADESFFCRFQQYDYLAMQVSGLASAELGYPLLCSGANLAFTKTAFITVNGFEGNDTIASGDDVFLHLKIQKKYPGEIKVLKDEKAIAISSPQFSLKNFIDQRLRWGGKVRHYHNAYISLVGGIVLTINLILLIVAIGAFQFHEWWTVFICCFIVKVFIDFVFLKVGASFFSIKISFLFFLASELLYPFYFLGLIGRSLIGKVEWKGRILRT